MPRYRQRVQQVPGQLANPVWVDDDALRPRLPRTPLRAAAPGLAPTSCASSSAASSPARSTGAARCGRSTSSRGWPTARSRCSTRPTRRSSTASRPSTSARCCSTATDRGPRSLDGDDWHAAPPPVVRRAARVARCTDTVTEPRDRGRHRARHARRRPAHRRAGRLGGSARVGNALTGRRPERETPLSGALSQQRRVVTRDDRAGRLPHGSATTHGGTVNDVILATVTGGAAGLADDPRRVDGRAAQGPGGGPGLGDRPRARGHLARQPDRPALRRPADRRGQPGGPPAPGVLLVPGAQGDRSRGRRQPARRHRRLRADDVPRDRLAGGRGRAAPRLPDRDHQRPRPAVTAVRRRRPDGRHLPGPAAAAATSRWRSASRPTTARSSTASPPTATWSPTPTCSASASARPSTSCSTPSSGRARLPRAPQGPAQAAPRRRRRPRSA